ncbi:MAG: hypothetical protein ABIV51_00360 [Saprospiraceae bacterium]
MAIITVKITKEIFIFQEGNILELQDHLLEENGMSGYYLPDIGDGISGMLPLENAEIFEAGIEEAEVHFGKCILTLVSNYSSEPTLDAANAEKEIGVVLQRQVQMIHYPDCQQLVFHMPKFAWDAGDIWLEERVIGREIFRSKVSERLSGSTMIVLDTLPLRPGFYTLMADWPGGWTHQLKFIKMIPGFPKDKEYVHPPGNLIVVQNDQEYKVYDSNKVEIIEEVDQNRKTVLKDLFKDLTRRVEYHQDGRGGTIDYLDGDIKITLDWEFAGGRGVVIIFVPEPKYWEMQTKTPIEQRIPILHFIAAAVIRDQAPNCSFELTDGFLTILR